MKKIGNVYILLLVLSFSCKEKYVPQLNLPVTSFLVVEGFINSGAGATTITLSRTTKLADTAAIIYETKANVRVEGKTNTAGFQLTETAPGKYTIAQLLLNANDQYRLRIKTLNGKEYVSDYSALRSTPAIDSVSWKPENAGVQIYVTTHDPQAKSKYYQYTYDETWEFHSKYHQFLKLSYGANGKIRGVGFKDSSRFTYDSTVYKCWKTSSNTNITIATSEQLTQDIILLKPLQFIEAGSWKLSQLYTILVKQRVLSREGYRYFEQLKKNTEQLGTIFDSQPSDNNGNIHCITNPNEIALGYVEVAEEKEQRIWINNTQLTNWFWETGCEPEIKIRNHPDSLELVAPGHRMLTDVAEVNSGTGAIVYVYGAQPKCVDCNLLGVNKKPPFWP